MIPSESLDVVIQNRKLDNQERVIEEREKIASIRKILQKNVKKVDNSFQQDIEGYIQVLKKLEELNTSQGYAKIATDAEKKGRRGVWVIFRAIDAVERDLTRRHQDQTRKESRILRRGILLFFTDKAKNC